MSEGAYALLKDGEVMLREGVGLCDDGNKIDARAQALHHLDIKRRKPIHPQ